MLKLTDLAPALQHLFGPVADRLAAETGFCQRRRVLTGPAFARTLALGWLARPDAPLEALVAAAGLPVTPQAAHARVGPEAAEFLARLLAHAVATAHAPAANAPLLRRFNGVYAEDLTDLGPAGKALVRYDIAAGTIAALELLPADAAEVPAAAARPTPPPGSVRLADRGFFDAAALKRLTAAGVHWVTRIRTGTKVSAAGAAFVPLADWLAGRVAGRVDRAVRVGEGDPVAGRLIARRCPPAVAAERRRRLAKTARRKGQLGGRAAQVLCEWTVYFTDLPADRFGEAELEVLYRCRWQVELLFKRLKSLGGVGKCGGRRPDRHRVETLAKLLAAVVAEWATLLGGGPLATTAPVARVRLVRAAADRLAATVGRVGDLVAVLAGLLAAFRRLPKRRRRRSPSTRQLVYRPRVMA